jgi:plastocyanin
MTPRILTLSLAIAIAAVLLVAACSAGPTPASSSMSSSMSMSSSASPTSVQAAGPTIVISGMKFPAPVSVAPGATVTVTNSDGAEHTVTADAGNAFNVEIEGKETATFTAPTQPGTYAYHCTYHPTMHGELIVA